MGKPVNSRMSDEQTWAIATAPSYVSDRELSDTLRLKESAVHARRWTIRSKGWTCRVRYATCLHCGSSMTLPYGNTRTDRPYHARCRPELVRQHQRQQHARRTPEQLAREREVTRSAVTAIQEQTVQRAVNSGAPWTELDDAFLEANLHRRISDLADELGRTYYAVELRVKALRKRAPQT